MKLRGRSWGVLSCVLMLSCGGDGDTPAADSGGVKAAGGGGAAGGAGPTFHADVEPVLQKRCQSCHHEGGIAPMALSKYDDARALASAMAAAVTSRRMPPWGEAPTDECKPPLGFRDDLRLTDAEIDLFARWAEGGAPRGDPAQAPAPVQFGDGKLDGVTDDLTFQKDYTLTAGTTDQFVCFVIDPKITETTYLDGLAVVPGNPLVDHHVLVFKDTKRASLALADAEGKYPCFGGSGVGSAPLLAAWAPGVQPANYGPDTALEIEKDSLLIVQMHYHPQPAADAVDRTRVQLRRRQGKPTYVARTRLLGNATNASGALRLLPGPADPPGGVEFRIPAGAKGHTETIEFTVPSTYQGARLAAVGTHMHWVGTDMKVEIAREGGDGVCLVQTPNYDFNWQRAYAYDTSSYEQLPELRPGDVLRIRCTYDNTMGNPRLVKALQEQHLPAPIDVLLGEETLDEMCLGAFTIVTPLDTQGGGGAPVDLPPLPCDVGAVPADLPPIVGSFAALDPATGSGPPAPTGGDPRGLWYVDQIVTYLPPNLAGIVDLEQSTLVGKGFFDLRDDGTYRQMTQTLSTLVTGPAGTLEQPSSRSSTGKFTAAGTEIQFQSDCPAGATTSSFSVVGDRLTVISQQKGAQGDLTIVLGAARVAPGM